MNPLNDIPPTRCQSSVEAEKKVVVMKTTTTGRVNVKEMRHFWEKQKWGGTGTKKDLSKPQRFKPKARPNIKIVLVGDDKQAISNNKTSDNDHQPREQPRTPEISSLTSSQPTLQDVDNVSSAEADQDISYAVTGIPSKVTSGIQAMARNRQSGVPPQKQLSSRKGMNMMSLDELLESNHKPLSYHRRASQRRMELQKALSYGRLVVMQDNTFHSKDTTILKESLHRAQQKVKEATQVDHSPDPWSVPELAKELSDIFVNALFLDDNNDDEVTGGGVNNAPKLTVEQMRDLVIELSVDEMQEIIKHFELCQKTNTAVRWDLIESIVSPDLDDEEDDNDDQDGKSSDSTSYIMSDDGEGFDNTIMDYLESGNDDDDSEATGFSIEAHTASCHSSITGFWSLYSEEDGSFADEEIEEVLVDDDDDVEIVYEYEENY